MTVSYWLCAPTGRGRPAHTMSVTKHWVLMMLGEIPDTGSPLFGSPKKTMALMCDLILAERADAALCRT